MGLGFREGFRALDFSGLAAVVGAFFVPAWGFGLEAPRIVGFRV